MKRLPVAAGLTLAALMPNYAVNAVAQAVQASALCDAGAAVFAGIVHDSTGASIAGATVSLDSRVTQTTAADGRFRFACIANGTHHIHVAAESFAALDTEVSSNRGALDLKLKPQQVEQAIDVSGDEATAHGVDNTENSGSSRTIQGDSLKALADDPDDLKRQLQQLTAGNGGDPSTALITVDGFQTSSSLPPKSAIAYIRVNPDPFSSEYQEPPYMGGRVEVYTKPGASRVHGALYMAYGGSSLNASDPFSVAKGKLGKQRYGFDLSGPVRRQGSDFALSLQHRDIHDVAVVNAVTLDSTGNPQTYNATLPKPQTQWEGSARLGWQLGPKNTFIANYTVFQQGLTNAGVGGVNLPEQGYNSTHYEHVARFTDITTVSATVMHEARFSMRWNGDLYYPASTAPQVQVSGAFNGGGAPLGAQQQREFQVDVLDDAIITTRNHTLKLGLDMRSIRERMQSLQNQNGTFTFGGGIAPVLDSRGNATSQTALITGLEQYRRATLGLPGGTPTAYTVVTGSPAIAYTQIRPNLFVQDDWKLRPNLKLSGGLRFQAQNRPSIPFVLIPRVGIAWSPDRKQTWTLRAHAGMFAAPFTSDVTTELERLGNPVRQSLLIYSPSYASPLSRGTAIRTVRSAAPGLGPIYFSEEAFGVEHSTKLYSFGGDFYLARLWNEPWTRNINTPLNGDPYGPRPITPNMNLLQTQNSGSGGGHAIFSHAQLQGWKPLNLYLGYVYAIIRDAGDNDVFSQPQSSTSNAGEIALRTNQNVHSVIINGTAHLPWKLDLSTESSIRSGRHYNVTTGFDNNGDGNFNDRPRFAAAGDPTAVPTPFGMLTSTGGTGTLPRNIGELPWVAYVDTNLSRSFTLTPHAQKDHGQTLSANIRAANVLNHTNVTRVGGVLGSPLFTRPYAADTGRRVEFGLRYAF